jgi:flagellar biosynthesis protein FlhB
MAEEFNEAKTEAPTQHRRDEAREQGQVARSNDLASSLVLLAGLVALALGGGTLASGMLDSVRVDLLFAGQCKELVPEQVQGILAGMLSKGMELVGLLCALAFLMALGAGALQVGFHVTPLVLAVNWERLSPAQGWSRLFSLSAVVRGILAGVKIAVVLLVAYWILKSRFPAVVSLSQVTLASTVAQAWKMILQVALAIAGTLVVVGAIDYGWQWWKLEQSLRMSRPELKEETKREQGNPQIKMRVRKLQREAAQKRMLRDVPKATVVITNPTHLAVALRYDRGTMPAPRVVAKGAGVVAGRIVALARRHAVPVVERKPVAQALFKTVKVGQEIPLALYHVVAEVLAYLFRLRAG